MENIQVSPRKTKFFTININSKEHTACSNTTRHVLSWYFRTDGDVFFGIFFKPHHNTETSEHECNINELCSTELEKLEYRYLFFYFHL